MKKSSILILSGACLSGASNAALIANWDGTANDIVPSGSQAVTQETTFTTASFQSPAQGANYYPASANDGTETPNFYAAKDNTAVSNYTVFDGGNADLLGRVQVAGATVGLGINSMFVFANNGDDTSALESLTLGGTNTFGAGASNGSVRFLFQQGGSWYASASIGVSGGGASIADATAVNWFDYTPHNAGVAIIGASATPTFTNVTHVGWYQQFDSSGGGGIFSNAFSATTVPEPSVALISGFGILGLLRRRRQH